MKGFRIAVAAVAVAALIAAALLTGLTASKALANAASASGGAARAVYCPPGDKKRRHAQLQAFEQSMQASRKAYFKTHPSASARKAFVHQQQAQHAALVASYAHCS